MADNKSGRDKQAHDEAKRQQKREMVAELERMDETEPPVPESDLSELKDELEAVSFPATGAELVEAVGDVPVYEEYVAADLLPATDADRYETAGAVTAQVQRPTVAGAMKQITEASETVTSLEFGRSQWDAYQKTMRALTAIDADDDDMAVTVMTEWIVDKITAGETLPGSRAVRRQAATFCREAGYEIRNDEWLGV
ncbi:hypothetical protein GRX03_00630 [Halovenus sp. WSH3]|uniref:Uncharacterized protein n=1 Tax=Halovenus carboxidivorans TaxID=2692199 RepID=A0A6B0SXP4_9EURY|nr:hypothetical protein [Halovenus carboxidivorans]MXR50115.1 hypothetical protein [Halovenus carboxidivorans]